MNRRQFLGGLLATPVMPYLSALPIPGAEQVLAEPATYGTISNKVAMYAARDMLAQLKPVITLSRMVMVPPLVYEDAAKAGVPLRFYRPVPFMEIDNA